ncbi:MAG: ABC transporter ATP-binding protein [Sedimentisphaerales bacterium]|nr:ABC transporter ATP-binding protein [Sedimentisphaerales bacterium]
MSVAPSQLLNRQIPEELAVMLRRRGVEPSQAWLCVETDLNLAGQFERVFLLVFERRLIVAGMAWGDQSRLIRIDLPRDNITQVRTRGGVGGGFLEAVVSGIAVDFMTFSNGLADTFAKVARKLNDWCENKPVSVGIEDDYNPRKCPVCGMTLQFPGDVCRRCAKQGAVLWRVIKLMKPYSAKATLMMLFVLFGIALSLVPPKLTQYLIDKVLTPVLSDDGAARSDAIKWLIMLVAALLGVYVLGMVVTMIRGLLSSFVGTQISFDMRARVFDHITKLGISYHDRYSPGQLMTRISGDTAALRGFVDQLTSGFLAQLITVVAVGVIMFSLSWKLTLYTLAPAPLVIASAVFFYARVRPRYSRIWDAQSKLSGVLSTILSGIRVVKAFGQELHERNRFTGSSEHLQNSERNVEYAVWKFTPAMGLLFQLGSIIVWFVGGKDVLDSQLTLGELIAFLGYLGMFYAPLGTLTQLTTWLTSFLTAAQRTFEILDTRPDVDSSENAKSVEAQGAITFKNVTFGYNRHEPILRDVSFKIKPGEHIGIVGKSGCGKTTLVNLISRFYDTDRGQVLIDGEEIRNLNVDDLRRSIGVVLQEPFLFRGTISANITYGQHNATPEQIITSAKAANAHDFIARLPLGYDTYIGERGAGLSGGERQRISIARALLFDPKVLILDEATSNVDTESEKLIQDALVRITSGRTTIAIAHRLSTLKNCDRIFVMDRGSIIEHGSHEELMEQKGLYYRLVKIQTELSSEPSIDVLTAEDEEEKEKNAKKRKTKS